MGASGVMPDRDAEIMAMVDEFLSATAPPCAPARGHDRSLRQRAHDAQWARDHRSRRNGDLPPMPEDTALITDETPLDDVLHSGVIGTEE